MGKDIIFIKYHHLWKMLFHLRGWVEEKTGLLQGRPGSPAPPGPSDFTCPRREGSYIWWEPFLLLGWQSGHSPNLPRTVPMYTCCAIISNNTLFIFRRVLCCFHGEWLSDRLSRFSKWAKDQCRFRALAFLFSLVSFPSSNEVHFKVEKKSCWFLTKSFCVEVPKNVSHPRTQQLYTQVSTIEKWNRKSTQMNLYKNEHHSS